MNVCWTSWVLLTLFLPDAAEPQSALSCDGKLLVQVSVNATVSVPCPNVTGHEIMFRLFKDEGMVDRYRYQRRAHPEGRSMFTLREGRSLWMNPQNGAARFELSGVSAEDSGSYSCDAWIYVPPPARSAGNGTSVFVFVKGPCLGSGPGPGGPGAAVADASVLEASCVTWGWSLAFWTAVAYGLVITVITVLIWLKLRGLDSSQNDYVNTKPAPPPGGKKRQGVQLPPIRSLIA